MPGASNNKSLYEILGVKPEATLAEIHVAYEALVGTDAAASALDPARRLALKEAHAILSSERRRAAYDESLRRREAPPVTDAVADDDEPGGPSRKLLIAGGLLLLIIIGWWLMRGPGPAPRLSPASPPPAALPAQEPAAPAPADPAVAAETAREQLLHGSWRCQGPLTGRGLDLNFSPDGTYAGQSDGQPVRGYYKLAGSTLTLSDSAQSNSFVVEELLAPRLVISRGEGRRLTCTR